MLNIIWLVLLAGGILIGFFTGNSEAVGSAVISGAGKGVEVTLGMAGIICFWSGIIKIAEKCGAMNYISKLLSPLIRFTMPNVPADSPAAKAVSMNLAANMLGLGNAATPLGIKAIRELDALEPCNGRATDNMIMFLTLNMASFQLVPTMVLSIRAGAGSSDPGSVIPAIWFSSLCATIVGIIVNFIFSRILRRGTSGPTGARMRRCVSGFAQHPAGALHQCCLAARATFHRGALPLKISKKGSDTVKRRSAAATAICSDALQRRSAAARLYFTCIDEAAA